MEGRFHRKPERELIKRLELGEERWDWGKKCLLMFYFCPLPLLRSRCAEKAWADPAELLLFHTPVSCSRRGEWSRTKVNIVTALWGKQGICCLSSALPAVISNRIKQEVEWLPSACLTTLSYHMKDESFTKASFLTVSLGCTNNIFSVSPIQQP